MSSSFVRRGRRFQQQQQQQQQQHQLEQKTLSATREVDDDEEGRRVRREDATSDTEEHEKRKIKSEFENEETKRNGTRPGAHGGVGGSRLISTGTEDLDDVLGGGLPLNTLFGIFLDDSDDERGGLGGGGEAVANVFASLFLSEGALACEQIGLWLTTDDDEEDDERDLRETLPRMMTRRSDSTGEMDGEMKNSKNDGGEGRGGAETAAEDSEKKAESSSGDGLKIAWQYRRYLEKSKEEKEKSGDTRSRGGALNSESKKMKMKKLRAFCHDFDVTRAHSNEEAMNIPIDVVQCDVSRNNIGKTFEAVKSFGKKLVEKDSVGRIVIQPPRALLDDPSNAIVFKNYLALLHAVKGFMQRGDMVHRMASFVLFPSKQLLSRTKLSDLRQTCDCYVETSSLLNPEFGFDERATAIESVLPEPTINCIALLSLGKKCFPGALAGGFGTVDSTFVVQRRGKKYAIKPLAQRPEDHDANNEKKTNGSGGLCSSGPTGIGSEGPLDF
ncbi:unnamed protein product [Bathycoccus prasinos]|jgi:elongator complex protein 4